VVISNQLTSREINITNVSTTTFEVQSTSITSAKTTFILTNIYRPPSCAPSACFYNELSSYLSELIIHKSLPIILCGDFNCAGEQSDCISSQLQNVLDSLNFTQHVNKPTRGENLLDIIATDGLSLVTSTSVISSHQISDHSLIKCSLNVQKPPTPTTHYKRRPLHRLDFTQLDNTLYSSTLITNPASNVDDYVQQINTVVNEELDKVAPFKSSVRVQRPLPCDMFLSADAISAKRERRRLERLWLRTGSDTIRQQYRAACRDATKKINDSRSNLLADKIRLASVNARDKWRQYRTLLHCSSVKANPGLGTNSFCNNLALFFRDKINKL